MRRTDAQPFVSGKRLILADHSASHGGPTLLGVFSCHWAAVAALVRLYQPEFRSVGGDGAADLAVESRIPAILAEAGATVRRGS
jgi:hypothetical protein